MMQQSTTNWMEWNGIGSTLLRRLLINLLLLMMIMPQLLQLQAAQILQLQQEEGHLLVQAMLSSLSLVQVAM
jgi:hypothetical protein